MSKEEETILGIEHDDSINLFKPVGCNKCIKGYRGRIPVHEVMYIDHNIKRLIDTSSTTEEIKEYAIKNGMKTLYQRALELSLKGITSIEEVLRIGYTIE